MRDDADYRSDNHLGSQVVQPEAVHIKIIETEEEFEKLSEAWSALARAVPGCLLIQTQDWCRLCWQYFGSKPTDILKILTAWSGERLVAIWPFRLRFEGLAKRIDVLGCGIGDTADPLIDPEFDTLDICRSLLATLYRQGDIIELSCLTAPSAMMAAVRAAKVLRYEIAFDDYRIDPGKWESWDAFIGHYSQKVRENLRRTRRNMKNAGIVSFESVRDPAAQVEAIDWILQQKRSWFTRNFFHRDWFYARSSRDFLVESLKIENVAGHVEIFLLKLDGIITAGAINLIDSRSLGGFIITHDPEFHQFSPGVLLVEDTVRWGYANGLIVEMGVGKADFKERWATAVGTRVTCTLARTPQGLGAMLPGYLENRWSVIRKKYITPPLKAILSREKINAIKSLLMRFKSRPQSS